VEAPLSPLVFGAFATIGAMSTRNAEPLHASRPFDRERDGFVMAEGAGVVFLERLDDARARGARAYGEVVGFGLTGDAHHMTAPRPDCAQATRAMRAALREASLIPAEVELIDAHGSATTLNDSTEARALREVFGEGTQTPITATKGQHGHALGATGAWEAAVALLALHDGRVPAVANLEHPDPGCDLAFVRATESLRPRVVLSNTSGFGGINAALVFKALEG
jgi:3-oxoacyl-[acyl-carrier-protein] synthase II